MIGEAEKMFLEAHKVEMKGKYQDDLQKEIDNRLAVDKQDDSGDEAAPSFIDLAAKYGEEEKFEQDILRFNDIMVADKDGAFGSKYKELARESRKT